MEKEKAQEMFKEVRLTTEETVRWINMEGLF